MPRLPQGEPGAVPVRCFAVRFALLPGIPEVRMTAGFADHFSAHAAAYAGARPHYPAAVFGWMADQCIRHELAWDAGCGNGQASSALAAHFVRVIATDPSPQQIAAAIPAVGVEYRVEPAEAPSLPPASADLVVIAQALHWFDQQRFHAAVARTLRPGGCIVALSYGLVKIDAGVDAVIGELYHRTLHDYWPRGREHVDDGYRTLPFPYRPIPSPVFAMTHRWDLRATLAYLSTWSAVQRFRRERGIDPLAALQEPLARAWGDPQRPRTVSWPLAVRAGRHDGGEANGQPAEQNA